MAYILNFSMMRIKEAWNLRTNCLSIETDDQFGQMYVICGVTSKTIDDDDARWVTSPSVELAVTSLSCISNLRMQCAISNPMIEVSQEDLESPWLISRCYEPWAGTVDKINSTAIRPGYPSYASVAEFYKNLFDNDVLKITKSDLDLARQVTVSLNEEKFQEGNVWNFAWHQLRRTGAVNMQGSELVSEPSMQYQLKHGTRAMSLYYGKGYSTARLNQSARNEYIDAMYEMLSKDLVFVSSERFISPHGTSRKSSIFGGINILDQKSLDLAIRKGMISWRPTLLGGCTKLGACPYGGVDNIIRCGGGDGKAPCADVIIDKSRQPQLIKFSEALDERLSGAEACSPLYESLSAQKRAIENILNAIKTK
ncbi:hypothetical protein HGP31_30285 [Pseudomonas umsongensis]|uniref:Uncharacterized protein n=1 Tax=Pseudomonas umsongensis TaxID=198618 RepID=A0AAE7A1C8_9PSED|nr:hypothetical protein HGP31_30285 [Pseudomonas umsongensis]